MVSISPNPPWVSVVHLSPYAGRRSSGQSAQGQGASNGRKMVLESATIPHIDTAALALSPQGLSELKSRFGVGASERLFSFRPSDGERDARRWSYRRSHACSRGRRPASQVSYEGDADRTKA